jgi:PAS domain S-box-containing protein
MYEYTPYILPFLIASIIIFFPMAYAWKRRRHGAAFAFTLLMLALEGWLLTGIFELAGANLNTRLFWANAAFIAIAPLSTAWLFVVAEYTGNTHRLKSFMLGMLIIAILTNIIIWTNDFHHLWRGTSSLDTTTAPFTITVYDYGPWFYFVHAPAGYIIYLISFVILLRSIVFSAPAYRQQLMTLLIAIILPILSDIMYIMGLTPIPNFNLTPIVFGVSGLIIAWSLYRYQFLDLMPVARDRVIESMEDIVIVVDEQNRVVDLNPAARRIIPQTNTNIIGQPIAQIFPHRLALIERYNDVQEIHTETIIGEGEEQRQFDLRISALFQRKKQASGRLIVLRDITNRIQTEESLKETNRRLELLRQVDTELAQKLDVAYVASIALDAAMRMSMADAAFISLVEDKGLRIVHALGQVEQMTINQLMPQDRGIAARIIRTRKAEFVPDVSQDPDYLPLVPGTCAQITVPLLSNDKLIGVLDLETSKAEHFTPEIFETVKLLANRVGIAIDNAYVYEELDAFAHTVAHDLKNPLAVIIAYANMLIEDTPEGEMRKLSEAIFQSGKKANEIIEELLLLAQVRSAAKIDIELLNMSTIVEGVQQRFITQIKEQQAEIILPDSWLEANGYDLWVEEIWANYLSNAIKYGGRPPRVELGCDRRGDKIRFWVKDNGAGLTEKEQQQLFQPFTRIGQTSVQGHGLGLSIVQRIAGRLQGEVGVESEVGKGSTFYFTLPDHPSLTGKDK